MPLLRVVLKASPAYYLMVWTTWPSRVEAFRRTFVGSAYANVGSPVIDYPRAIVYLQCPPNVTESHLDGFRRHWSERVAGIAVDGAPVILPTQQAIETDKAALRSLTPVGQFSDQLSRLASGTGRAVLIGAVVVAVAYAVARSQGTRAWD